MPENTEKEVQGRDQVEGIDPEVTEICDRIMGKLDDILARLYGKQDTDHVA